MDSSPPPSLAPDQHGAQAARTPMDMETREPRPTAPAALVPGRSLSRQPKFSLRPPKFTVEGIFRNFTIRRAALIRAITTDEGAFFHKCDPDMEHLYLCANTDGMWEVKRAESDLPPSQPEPALGINVSRDKMKRHEWLQEVAMHCDAWLISISFYFGSFLSAQERQSLFTMMNSQQTVREAFLDSDTYRRLCHLEEKGSSGPLQEHQEEEVLTSEDSSNFCASCGGRYNANSFWICCNFCYRWYHGRCVKVTADEAEHIEHYECPECCSDKVGHDYDEDMLFDPFKRY